MNKQFLERARASQNPLAVAIANSADENTGLLTRNIILEVDTYKRSQMPLRQQPNGTQVRVQSYGEARLRGAKETVYVPFGFVQQFAELLPFMQATKEKLDEAIQSGIANNIPMNETEIAYWKNLIEEFDGWPQFKMKIVPEGTPMNTGAPVYTIEACNEHAFWPQYLEDVALRPAWFDGGIATRGYNLRRTALRLCEQSGADPSSAFFMVNDFGLRGSNTDQAARYSGTAILVSSLGTDNEPAVRNAMYYYGTQVRAGFGAKATEHSIQLSYGPTKENQKQYLMDVITKWRAPNAIISIVMDGIDYEREVTTFCTDADVQALVRETVAMGCRIVLRPDSGDMNYNVKFALDMICANYGYVTNAKGYRKPALNIGVIQGDGITDVTFNDLYGYIIANGYSADCLVTGSGGWLLNTMRDDLRVAQKMCFYEVNGVAVDVAKKTIGKESFGGLLSCYLSNEGKYKHYDVRNGLPADGVRDVMVDFIDNTSPESRGKILYLPTLDEIRTNTGLW